MKNMMVDRSDLEFGNIYRGKVVDNYDPEIMGRCKLFVPGIYPDAFRNDPGSLPWAEPVMPIYGGSYHNPLSGSLNNETGVTTIPHVGAELWMFFESGNHMHPKFFGACQAGSGWMSEHDNQHVIKTDNVRIRIDEKPALSGSTCKFDSYNAEVAGKIPYSKSRSFTQRPTRVDVQIKAVNNIALNVQIEGDVNMNIVGNVIERIVGDKHETHIGNHYRYHRGDTWVVDEGAYIVEKIGDTDIRHRGSILFKLIGDMYNSFSNLVRNIVLGERSTTVYGRDSEDIKKDKALSVGGMSVKSVSNISMEAGGNISEQCSNRIVDSIYDIYNTSLGGNIVNRCLSRGYYDREDSYRYKFRGGVISEGDYIMNMAQGSIVDVSTMSGRVYDQIVTDTEKVEDMFTAISGQVRYPVDDMVKLANPLNPELWNWQYAALEPVYDEMGLLVIGFDENPMVIEAAPVIKMSADSISMQANETITMKAVEDIYSIVGPNGTVHVDQQMDLI